MKVFEIFRSCIFELCPILSVFSLCLAYQIYLYNKNKILNKKIILKHFLLVDVFLLYIALMYDVAGTGTIWDIGKYPEIIRTEEISIIPFSSDGILTYLLNIIMFMPFGFLTPFIWEKFQSIKRITFWDLTLSIYIEIAQLFNRRKTDIDDVLMNVLGTILGFGILYIWNKKRCAAKRTRVKLKYENAGIYLIFTMIGRFLFYNWRFLVKIFEKATN